MSHLQTEVFWEQMHETHWNAYVADCERSGTRPGYSDFMVWCEDKDLVVEP